MPIIKSAKKKLRKDIKRTEHNRGIERNIKELIKDMRHKPSPTTLGKVFSAVDKAAKTHLIHNNRASRLKSRLSKLLSA